MNDHRSDENTFQVLSVNISKEKGVPKKPATTASIIENCGIEGDAHAGFWHRQVSLLSDEEIETFNRTSHRQVAHGEFAENITTRGLDMSHVAVFDLIRIHDIELEVTQIGKECHSGCAIFKDVGACIMPKNGIFTRVVHGGEIQPGMRGHFLLRDLKIRIITLSDRASKGVYEDRSGPAIFQRISDFFRTRRDHLDLKMDLIPDDSEALIRLFELYLKESVDLVWTTGSTGLGPRDIAPEATSRFCNRLIPSLMDSIRLKYGATKPAALLSRGVAGLRDRMMIVNLPGSVRAVEEYLNEMLPLWDHIRRMIHGVDQH